MKFLSILIISFYILVGYSTQTLAAPDHKCEGEPPRAEGYYCNENFDGTYNWRSHAEDKARADQRKDDIRNAQESQEIQACQENIKCSILDKNFKFAPKIY